MSELSIPVALDPHGNPVPIEEAVRFKTDYYRCPECGEIVNPRKGTVRTHFYAHKKGVLEDTSCELSSQADVDRMVDEFRTSDIEQEEMERQIRLYLEEVHGSFVNLFGILPSLEWEDVEPGADVDRLLKRLEIETTGVNNPPSPQSFHPSEPEVFLDLDESVGEYSIRISNADHLEKLQGHWTADGLSDGDLFIGDQNRARRHINNRQVKEGEWVYAVTNTAPRSLPNLASVYFLESFSIIGFPVQEGTGDLLEEYTDDSMADQYGFNANIVLPADANPTSEEPIEGESGEPVLICVTPDEEIDPAFEVVSVPRKDNDVTEIEPTGPGNPRYYRTTFPKEGSRRISIHQRNSSRHRLVHLHAGESEARAGLDTSGESEQIGLRVDLDDDQVLLSPLTGQSSITVGPEINLVSLPSRISYVGPEGLEIQVKARFSADAPHGPLVSRSTEALVKLLPEISHWATQGCEQVTFSFDSLGSVGIEFAPDGPESTPASADRQTSQEGG